MSTKGTILLVEDNHDLRNGLKDILLHDGFSVRAAANGREGLKELDQQIPDLIISDISMPEMNGYDFFDQVRARSEGVLIPFIFLTARGEREDVMKAHHLGIEDYLVKPLSRSELLPAIQAKLNRFRQIQMAQLEQSYEASLTVLANVIEVRDQYTRGHVERVRDYSLLLARAMKLSEKQQRIIRFGAILHDIGKILVRETTLLKSTPLSQDEWIEIRQHPVIGSEMLKGIPYLAEIIPLVRYHHEHWDGQGYPEGLAGEAIPIEARIVSVADGFDAITTDRPYHPAWLAEKAAPEIIREAGSYFDPAVIAAFQKVWENGDLLKVADVR